MKQKSLFVAQSGGPTSVINSTLAGIIAEAGRQLQVERVYGLLHGLEGALRGEIVDLSNLSGEELDKLRHTPAAILGGSRYPLNDEDILKIAKFLKDNYCQYFLFIGGNGTMDTCLRLQNMCQQEKIAIEVVGVPKTVDNDLEVTDHAPGYGSAARYVALSVRDQVLDLQAMQRFEQVRIIETMGRMVGWLAAASFLAMGPTTTINPLFIPEVPVDEDEFIAHIDKVYKKQGYVLAVIGEGLRNKKGEPMGNKPFAGMNDTGCHTVRTGAAEYLAQLVNERLGVRARAQILGMNQRSFAACVSPIDEEEAYRVGRAAVRLAVEGGGGQMVTLIREGDYSETGVTPLERVAGIEKQVPLNYYDQVNKRVTQEFVEWLAPLVGEIEPVFWPGDLRTANAATCAVCGGRTCLGRS
ncbi:diphosphate--fructose-6-phosphate 1-phosphotransferase [Moorella sulfitireducens (nom. illeg.)]|uniref:diphosphate--fructose-6-phosphate 1-phosphotransferase n=1 Tax=Neomoorella sulfitireducens TaxID=2972948 RepID=UPI0021ACE619|nr:diphosphate--fructose-6-phosphate 1-phosphotransferase [Moorella sulfitireducens]